MPIYEYDCRMCGHTFDKLQKMVDRAEAECPICKAFAKQKISPVRAKLDPISGDFPGATMSWEKRHADKLAQERKSGNHEE